MKPILLFLICLASITDNLFGQSYGSIGTEWYYSENANGLSGAENGEFVHFKSVSDTIIQGIKTNKITSEYFKYNGVLEILEPMYTYQKLDTVFIYSFEKSKFLKLYIFNALPGQTIILDVPGRINLWNNKSTYRLYIDSVKLLVVDGVKLKEYYTKNLDLFSNFTFMDRIGSTAWIIPRGTHIPEAGGPIRCYKDTQIDTNFQKVACDRSVFSVSKILQPTFIELFPNPVNKILTIKTKETIEKLEIYDWTGMLIRTTTESFVDFSDLSNGLYIAKVYIHTGVIYGRKIIKS